eukprot:CAMPEP_0113309404 /NCGR_PEP_ID=MMETSP0010_2-20120614/7465_1 /TAXON_ID=216773 ORGANISM="Corethron hystrix, Strain 308" /NCGR_SAMPLE_ID=MMETSP0010_2 /ASSEMBLY_ACC=CAM_ASM_000155 /LENGTH=430 /DNA_ID=CAMNT_0000164657 /DNA_START=253 /DNA_END=1545 /DNA_ORIENTATION=+ /assembly_acc=CAM_ASM_000155
MHPSTNRSFHSTPRREILPLVLGVVIGTVGYYSYRAVNSMEEEMEEYERLLAQHEGREYVPDSSHPSELRWDSRPIISIDIGSGRTRTSFSCDGKTELIEANDGARSLPTCIAMDEGDTVIGKLAMGRGGSNPISFLEKENDEEGLRSLISVVMSDVRERRARAANAAVVLTYPPRHHDDENILSLYLSSVPAVDLRLVPSPVAAALGAQSAGLLKDGKIIVLDVGAGGTDASIVSLDDTPELLSTVRSLDVSVTVLRDATVRHLLHSSKVPQGLAEDPMAKGRLREAAEGALQDLSVGKIQRSQVNIPYISVDKNSVPIHLQCGVGWPGIRFEIESGLSGRSITDVLVEIVTDLLTTSATTPMDIRNILLVGGGGRNTLVQMAVKEAMGALGGSAWADEAVVVPEGEVVEELTVLGAAEFARSTSDGLS